MKILVRILQTLQIDRNYNYMIKEFWNGLWDFHFSELLVIIIEDGSSVHCSLTMIMVLRHKHGDRQRIGEIFYFNTILFLFYLFLSLCLIGCQRSGLITLEWRFKQLLAGREHFEESDSFVFEVGFSCFNNSKMKV